MATWYFSSSLGNDAWSGTLPDPNGTETDGPKQTIAAAETILNNTAAAGDTICLRRGDTWAENLDLDTVEGSVGNPITIGAYSTGALPILNPTSGDVLTMSNSNSGNNVNYVTVENLHITTSGGFGARANRGIFIWHAIVDERPDNIILSGLTVEDLQGGLVCYFTNLTIDNCTVRNNFKGGSESGNTSGIYLQGDGLTFTNNTVDNNGRTTNTQEHNVYLEAGDDLTIEGCEILNGPDGIKVRRCSNVTIRDNHIHDTASHTQVGGDSAGNSSNITIERNRMHGMNTAIAVVDQAAPSTVATTNVVIRNNLCYDYQVDATRGAGWPGMISVVNDLVDTVHVYNNVVWGDSDNCLVSFAHPTMASSTFRNNILFTSNASNPLVRATTGALTNMDFDHNCYYRTDGGDFILNTTTSDTYATIAALQLDYASQETNGLEEDPVLVDPNNGDFKVGSATAPVVDAGEVIGTGLDDFDGISRPDSGSWEIGAYEYVGFIPPAGQLVITSGVPIFFEGQGTSVNVSPDAGQLMLDGVVSHTVTGDILNTTVGTHVPTGADVVLVKRKRDGGTIDRLGGFTPLNIKPEK